MQSDTPLWVSAAATTLAALVALFGPGLRRWWSRPQATLHHPSDIFRSVNDLIFTDENDQEQSSKRQFILLDVTNHGRTQLNDVEAVLTAYDQIGPIAPEPGDEDSEEIPAFELESVSRGLLQFELADADHPRINIPPKTTRTLRIAYLATNDGTRGELRERGEDLPANDIGLSGGWTLWPLAGTDRMTWLVDNGSTTFEIAISASNARSRSWRATVRAWAWEGMSDEPGEIAGITIEWEKDLRRVRASLPPTPRRAWVMRHTPWAIWRDRQFRRELERARAQASERDQASS